MRGVEAEQAGFDLLDGEAADRAGEAGAEHGARAGGGVLGVDDAAVGEAEGGLEAVGEARLDAGADDDTVDHGVDVVLGLAVEGGDVGDLVERAVHFHAGEAAALQLGQLLAVLALAVAHDGGEQEEAGAFGHGGDSVDHLADGLGLDRLAGGGRVGGADAGPEQAHVVVDLGDRADGAARVAAGGLLLDGDGRRQALDAVHVGLAHQFEELAGVGGQAFHVAALALGVDGVEGEGGLAGAAEAGDDGEAVARDLDVDVLEVVLARAADTDVGGHGRSSCGHGAFVLRRRGSAAGGVLESFPVLWHRGAGLGRPHRPGLFGSRSWAWGRGFGHRVAWAALSGGPDGPDAQASRIGFGPLGRFHFAQKRSSASSALI